MSQAKLPHRPTTARSNWRWMSTRPVSSWSAWRRGPTPPPPQTFAPPVFLAWAAKQVKLAREVVSCYEAGPTGFWLHRQLSALGVRNFVVCPTRLDERCRGVANDRTDPLELATRLDRYLEGNERALAVETIAAMLGAAPS